MELMAQQLSELKRSNIHQGKQKEVEEEGHSHPHHSSSEDRLNLKLPPKETLWIKNYQSGTHRTNDQTNPNPNPAERTAQEVVGSAWAFLAGQSNPVNSS